MNRKILSIIGVVLVAFTFYSCSSNPEQGLLARYFNALSLDDVNTLSTMALEPVDFKFKSWKIASVSEEVIKAAELFDMNTTEQELKKKKDESVGVTLDAKAMLDDAAFERDNARTRAARRAAQKKADELQIAYDEQYEKHQALQKEYNLAKEAAAREEEISNFSLGAEYPNIRVFNGEVASKEVEIQITGDDGAVKNYKIYLRKYTLQDEDNNLSHRGRWIIIKFEKI
jgi:hypothetical protein